MLNVELWEICDFPYRAYTKHVKYMVTQSGGYNDKE
jgi:hypothetical protein